MPDVARMAFRAAVSALWRDVVSAVEAGIHMFDCLVCNAQMASNRCLFFASLGGIVQHAVVRE